MGFPEGQGLIVVAVDEVVGPQDVDGGDETEFQELVCKSGVLANLKNKPKNILLWESKNQPCLDFEWSKEVGL